MVYGLAWGTRGGRAPSPGAVTTTASPPRPLPTISSTLDPCYRVLHPCGGGWTEGRGGTVEYDRASPPRPVFAPHRHGSLSRAPPMPG